MTTTKVKTSSLETLSKQQQQQQQQQKRKEKEQRRKHYNDQQVQGTNNSSIVSKRSVEKLYFAQLHPELGTWFSEFVPSLRRDRRSPAINRGYWIRMESVRQTLYKIIGSSQWGEQDVEAHVERGESGEKKKVVNVVNLGCGFDPLPFQVLSIRNKGFNWGGNDEIDVNFFDIDYPDLVQEKYAMIQKSQKIKQLIGEELPTDDAMCKLNTVNYKLIGCDLKNLTQYQHIVDHFFTQKNAPSSLSKSSNEMNVFIAEVSLAYMKPQCANPVIEISSNTANSNFIILEQIMPDGAQNAFATKMLYHFAHLRSPIQCVEQYPTKLLQLSRFEQYYKFAEVRNLFENWQLLIEEEEQEVKSKMMQVEEFDEWEEFILFCQHYIVLHATNDELQLVYDEKLNLDFQVDDDVDAQKEAVVLQVDEEVKLSIDDRFDNDDVDLLQVKFPACSKLNENIYVHGGLKQTRTNETIIVDYEFGKVGKLLQHESTHIPQPRMCHQLTNVGANLLLTGGRTRPGDVKDDIYTFDGHNWFRVGQLDAPRARHSAVAINDDTLLIFGGLPETLSRDPFILLNAKTNKIQTLEIRGEYIDNMYSATLVFNQKKREGYIYGGFNESHLPRVNDRLYKFTINHDSNQITLDVILQHPMFARIGSQGQLIDNNHEEKLLIVGGVCSETILTNKTSILTLQLDKLTFKSVEIPSSVSIKHPPIFIGFGLVSLNSHSSLIVGGGAVCYSFGSCYNCIYKLEY